MSWMALLKTKDLRIMRPEDLRIKLKELSDELMHERGVAAMGGAPASPGKIRALRTNIARIHTIIVEQEKGIKHAPAKPKRPLPRREELPKEEELEEEAEEEEPEEEEEAEEEEEFGEEESEEKEEKK